MVAGLCSCQNHGLGFGFILFGKDDVLVATCGFGSWLPQPCLCVAATDLVDGCRCCCCSRGSIGRHFGSSEPFRVSFVYVAGMPWEATPTLPQADKFLSSAFLAPSSVVKFVEVKLVPGAIHCMFASRAVHEDDIWQSALCGWCCRGTCGWVFVCCYTAGSCCCWLYVLLCCS